MPNSAMEANKTLHCLPKDILTSTTEIVINVPEIVCETFADCPRDMMCSEDKKCKPKDCDPSVDQDPESPIDRCDDHKMCFEANLAGNKKPICLPVFPCDMKRCVAPIQPAQGAYICHKYHEKCYVSSDDCQTSYDCMIKAKGEGEFICTFSADKQKKVCIDIDCNKNKPCPGERPTCYKNKCCECTKCSTNQDCPPYQQCLMGGGSKEEESGCCVDKPQCPPDDCNEVLGLPNGDYCLSGICTICYTSEGRVKTF
jgi:hypothetical protein